MLTTTTVTRTLVVPMTMIMEEALLGASCVA